MNHSNPKKSLALHILKVVFSIYLVVTILITLAQMANEYRLEIKAIQNILQTIQSVFESNLSIAMSTADSTQLEANLQGIQKIPAIVGIEIININKTTHWTKAFPIRLGMILDKHKHIIVMQNNQEILHNSAYLKLIPYHFQLKQANQIIGEVILYSSNQIILHRVSYQFLTLLLAATIKTMVLWLLFFWALNKFLGRELNNFCLAMEQADINTTESTYLSLQHANIKELYRIETAYNAMFMRVLETKDKLDALNKSLEDKVLSRTQELANKNQQLEQLNHEKTEFLSIASHNLKNPLATISSFTKLIKHCNNQDKLLKYNHIIEVSATRMFVLINNLLDTDKIESGTIEIHLVELDLLYLVQSLLVTHAKHAEDKNISIEINTDKEAYLVLSDSFLLSQILDNLLSNAFKYSPINNTVTISLFRKCDKVSIVIQNQGQGLKEKETEKLFLKFSRLSTKPTAGEHSTGLGLYIAQKMAMLLNTRIEYDCYLRQNPRFSLELPLIKK
ncbi:MAG: ATP-binding protein [Methylococcaceae bacterium]